MNVKDIFMIIMGVILLAVLIAGSVYSVRASKNFNEKPIDQRIQGVFIIMATILGALFYLYFFGG